MVFYKHSSTLQDKWHFSELFLYQINLKQQQVKLYSYQEVVISKISTLQEYTADVNALIQDYNALKSANLNRYHIY